MNLKITPDPFLRSDIKRTSPSGVACSEMAAEEVAHSQAGHAAGAGAGTRLIVGIPTKGRPDIVAQTVRFLTRQTRMPDAVLLSVSDTEDCGGVETEDLPFAVELIIGPQGLSVQRNAILDRLGHNDVLMFLDDDFLMAPDYLQEVERIFTEYPDIVLTTGTVVADGILGPGLNVEQGEKLLDQALHTKAEKRFGRVHTGYGCNMSIRMAPVKENKLQFDEDLPLYSWLEDVDFSSRLKPFGRFVRPASTRGVHLGTKTGRTPGIKLGYSQIINPIYLFRKGTLSRRRSIMLVSRSLGSNVVGTLWPRPWADYQGRLVGNMKAVAHLIAGRCEPKNVVELETSRTYRDGRWRKMEP